MQSRYRYIMCFYFFLSAIHHKERAEISGTGTFWPITSHWENLVEVDIQFIPMMPFVGHHHGYIPKTKNKSQQPCLKHQQKTGAFQCSVCNVTPHQSWFDPPKHTKNIHNPKEASRHRLGSFHVLGRLPFSPGILPVTRKPGPSSWGFGQALILRILAWHIGVHRFGKLWL